VATGCPHTDAHPTADNDLELCSACGCITRALTRDGELELLRLAARWGFEEAHAADGSFDYTLRSEPALKVVPKSPLRHTVVPKSPRPAWEGVRVG